MSYRVQIKPSVERALDRLPKADRLRVDRKILALADNPRPPGCVKLTGEDNLWRIRAGDYRIIYQIQDEVLLVVVVIVAHRRESYRRL